MLQTRRCHQAASLTLGLMLSVWRLHTGWFHHRGVMPNKDPKNGVDRPYNTEMGQVCSFRNDLPTAHADQLRGML